MKRSYRDELNDGLSQLATVIEHVWGPRCSMHEASCATCHQWAVFDYMHHSLDGMGLDDAIPDEDDLS